MLGHNAIHMRDYVSRTMRPNSCLRCCTSCRAVASVENLASVLSRYLGRTESAQAEPNSTAPHPATFSTARRRHEPLPDKPTLPSSTSGRCRCETLFFLRKRRGAVLPQLELEKRSFVKITERTYEKRAHALHRRRESTILRRHLLDKVPVSDLCEENGLQPRKRPTIQIVRDAR